MSARDELDRSLFAWMTETASGPPPAGRFEQAMEATARRRPRPRWLAAVGSDWVGTIVPGQVGWTPPRLRRGLVTAAVVALLVAALIGIQLVGPFGIGAPGPTETSGPTATSVVETPSPAIPTATPTAPPDLDLPAPEVKKGRLAPGSYTYSDVDTAGFNVRFTVPAGWWWNGRYLSKGDVGLPGGAAIYFFGGQVQVYADPCHWSGAQPSPQAFVFAYDLVDALAAQPSRSATKRIDRPANVPGLANRWQGAAVELTVPADTDIAACDGGQFRSWGPEDKARIHQGPGQHDLVWAVDLGAFNNQLIVDAASFPGTPADVLSEIDAILESIAAGHWG